MLFAQYTGYLSQRVGVEKAVNMLADAGFPAVDIIMKDMPDPPFCSDWRGMAKRLNAIAKERGIKFIQGHAPVGRWEHYINNAIPVLPDVFELVALYETLNDPEAFTICLDIGHVALCGREPWDTQLPTVLKFMAKTARYLADKIDSYRNS